MYDENILTNLTYHYTFVTFANPYALDQTVTVSLDVMIVQGYLMM